MSAKEGYRCGVKPASNRSSVLLRAQELSKPCGVSLITLVTDARHGTEGSGVFPVGVCFFFFSGHFFLCSNSSF